MEKSNFLLKIKDQVEHFLMERIKDNSGFSATPLLPPTIEDTYYGVTALRYINPSLLQKHKKSILSFVSSFTDKKITNPLLIYWIYKILDEIEEINPNIVNTLLDKTEFKHSLRKDIKSIYIFIKLYEYINNKTNIDYLLEILKDIKIKSLEDLYYRGSIDKDEWIDNIKFVLDSQNGDGGFGFFPGTTSYIENTYYALKILKHFKDQFLMSINKGLSYVIACYNGRGGFARKPGALASIEATSLAIQVMSL